MDQSALPKIDEVAPVDEGDRAVMDEVRSVLVKHGALQRFGLTLLHSHFDLADDEILVETVDAKERKLTIRPMPVREAMAAGDPFETSWRLDSPSGEPECLLYCFRSSDGTVHYI
jgi:hypothetical protein